MLWKKVKQDKEKVSEPVEGAVTDGTAGKPFLGRWHLSKDLIGIGE